MAENTEILSKEEDPKGPKNLFSLFPKFKLQFPFLKQEPEAGVAVEDEPRKAVAGDEGLESKTPKPDIVRFPKAQLVVPTPVAVEDEEPSTKTSNPIILWQFFSLPYDFSTTLALCLFVGTGARWLRFQYTLFRIWKKNLAGTGGICTGLRDWGVSGFEVDLGEMERKKGSKGGVFG